jgi:hypothetical protein
MLPEESIKKKLYAGHIINPSDHNIKVADSFAYLGSSITRDNHENIEIQRWL